LKEFVYFLCIVIFFCSCGKYEPVSNQTTETYKSEKLGLLQKILKGYVVTAIAFDSKGDAWIGTQSQGLIHYNEKKTVVYNSKNSVLPKETILDIAVDKNDNVWIGSDGLWKYDGKKFTLYNTRNTVMPGDVVWSIAIDSKNNIWLASTGLVKYDGSKWTAYTSDNSPLPINYVYCIAIDQSDNVWLALNGYVNEAYLVKFSNDKWEVFDKNDLGFTPYQFGGIQCDSKNRLWGAIDYSLSSFIVSPRPHFFIFDGKNTTQLSIGDNMSGNARSGITIDHNEYVWCFGPVCNCGVWIDEQWTQLDRKEFRNSSAWVIKEAPDHRMWFGTEDGIYIQLNKQ